MGWDDSSLRHAVGRDTLGVMWQSPLVLVCGMLNKCQLSLCSHCHFNIPNHPFSLVKIPFCCEVIVPCLSRPIDFQRRCQFPGTFQDGQLFQLKKQRERPKHTVEAEQEETKCKLVLQLRLQAQLCYHQFLVRWLLHHSYTASTAGAGADPKQGASSRFPGGSRDLMRLGHLPLLSQTR